jgi:hypothetical protein
MAKEYFRGLRLVGFLKNGKAAGPAADAGRQIAAYNRALRVGAVAMQRYFERKPGAEKRFGLPPKAAIMDLKQVAKEQLESMKRAHESGHEFAVYDALSFCRDMKADIPAWVVDGILSRGRETKSKKPGRHSRAAVRQAEMVSDWLIYCCALRLHECGRLWKQAYIETAERLGPQYSARTVRGACARARKRKSEYFSETVAFNLPR